MTDWTKHEFGPGTPTCCRCLRAKESSRESSKWCRSCDEFMGRRRGEGAAVPIVAERQERKYGRTKGWTP